ncbi:hypothetical protein [Pseudomonas sp. p99-361]|nr:hypothetical protein [Pseudomonas sp. p99-361]
MTRSLGADLAFSDETGDVVHPASSTSPNAPIKIRMCSSLLTAKLKS